MKGPLAAVVLAAPMPAVLATAAQEAPAHHAAPLQGLAAGPLALRRGLYVQEGRPCGATAPHAKTYDGSTLRPVHGGQCRTELLWTLQGVHRLRQACLMEDGRWRETGRPYVRVLDPQTFEIVEVRPFAMERPPAMRRVARYSYCPSASG